MNDDDTAVGADLSRPPPHCISHKRGIAETWDPAWGAGNNAFQVPIYRPNANPTIYLDYFVHRHYRPSGTLPGIPVILYDRFWLIDQAGQQKRGRLTGVPGTHFRLSVPPKIVFFISSRASHSLPK